MLDRVASGGSPFALVIWQTERCLVAPRAMARIEGFGCGCARSASAGWPVQLRVTGGDVVPQGAGVVNVSISYTLRRDEALSIAATYGQLCRPIVRELQLWGLACALGTLDGAFCDGAFNINIDGRKFAGTAQRWRRMRGDNGRIAIFSHAMLLMTAPAPAAIDAINRLYEGCGVGKRVRAEAHTGLTESRVCGSDGLRTAFLKNLRKRYADDLANLAAGTVVAAAGMR